MAASFLRAARAALLSALLLLLAAVVYGLGRLRTDGLASRLEHDTLVLAEGDGRRVTHVEPPLPGSFGEYARAPLLKLAGALGASRDAELCRAVRQGEAPVAALSPGCRDELTRALPAVDALLASTHAEHARPPEGMGVLDVPTPLTGQGLGAATYGAKLAVLQLWIERGAGMHARAERRCLDLLGLARDLAYGTGLVGRATSILVGDIAFRGCAAALDAAPAAEKEHALAALERLVEGSAPFADSLSEWSVLHRLEGFGLYLGPRLSELPPGARAIAGAQASRALTPLQTFWVKDFWHEDQVRVDALIDAAQLPRRTERLARIAALARPRPRKVNPLSREGYEEVPRLAEASEHARAQLRLLALAVEVDLARARSGRWPLLSALNAVAHERADAPGTALTPSGEEAKLADTSVPRGELSLTLHAD